MNVSNTQSSSQFTILDWIGVYVATIPILILLGFSFIAAEFKDHYSSLGMELPFITKAALEPGVAEFLGFISGIILALQFNRRIRGSLKWRRAVVVFSFIFSSTAVAICVIALYKPVFMISDALS